MSYPLKTAPFRNSEKQVATTSSAMSKTLEEANKKAAELKQKVLEEQKKKEDEERFIATYGPCYWLPILMYHHVDDKAGSLYVDPGTFANQMDYLVGRGYTTLSLNEAVADLSSGQIPAKSIVLTFDDGYRDFFERAYPILKQRNLKATVFIITQLMEGYDYLTWEQVRELAGSSLITIGDHTLDHRTLSALSGEQIKSEVFDSKGIIEGQIGKPVNVFAYPYGGYNQTAIDYLNQAGFVAAVTTQYGNQCVKLPLALRRIRIGRSSLASYGL